MILYLPLLIAQFLRTCEWTLIRFVAGATVFGHSVRAEAASHADEGAGLRRAVDVLAGEWAGTAAGGVVHAIGADRVGCHGEGGGRGNGGGG